MHFDVLRIVKTCKLPFASPTCALPPSHDSRPRSFFTYPLSFCLYPLEVPTTSFFPIHAHGSFPTTITLTNTVFLRFTNTFTSLLRPTSTSSPFILHPFALIL